MKVRIDMNPKFWKKYFAWKNDYCKAAREMVRVRLDPEQEAILYSIQQNRRTSVRSGTARGKDFVGAVGSILFLYLEAWNKAGEYAEYSSVKVINTAPTGRQIRNIMIPEISKFYSKGKLDYMLGRLMSDGIRWEQPMYKDWYLHGFKADDEAIESWSGIHAENVMVVITEASGLSQTTFDSIEGILQGNSRLVLIFNPNRTVGEAYKSQTSGQYNKFVLNCMNAPNVVNYGKMLQGEITEAEFRRLRIPGQVDYEWVDEKIKKPGWAFKIAESEVNPAEFDFQWNGQWYRPSDLFRVKVLGEFPKESDEQLIPISWIEAAQERYLVQMEQGWRIPDSLRLGVDVAGMGRDMTVFCSRKGWVVFPFKVYGKSSHMETAGKIKATLNEDSEGIAVIDTIGEGAGVYSRLEEQGMKRAVSCKFSEGAKGLKDYTEGYEFENMRAYLYWCIRDWLNPAFDSKACLPPDDELTEELTSIEYKFQSNGKIIIEPKEDIIERIGRSPDKSDALANTFYPRIGQSKEVDLTGMFH